MLSDLCKKFVIETLLLAESITLDLNFSDI